MKLLVVGGATVGLPAAQAPQHQTTETEKAEISRGLTSEREGSHARLKTEYSEPLLRDGR